MPSNLRSNTQSGPAKRSCVSVAAIGSSQSGMPAEDVIARLETLVYKAAHANGIACLPVPAHRTQADLVSRAIEGIMPSSTLRTGESRSAQRTGSQTANSLLPIICARCGGPVIRGQNIGPLFSAKVVVWPAHPVI